MSDLPSRDKRSEHGTELAYDHAEFAALANAWRSGRLVDREAFDYEAAGEVFIHESGPQYNPASGRAIVDAAIPGDGDE